MHPLGWTLHESEKKLVQFQCIHVELGLQLIKEVVSVEQQRSNSDCWYYEKSSLRFGQLVARRYGGSRDLLSVHGGDKGLRA